MKKETNRKEAMAHQENAEFGLLLNYTDKTQLEERIQKILSDLNTVLPGMKVSFGVGVYLVRPGESDIEQLYNNAMIACEMLGEEADNKTAFFDIEMNKQKMWERKVEDDMDKALENKEFQVYLQPKISTSEEALGGAEALVRWTHPTEGFIPPNRFIPFFEKNGFILKLDDYMLDEIARLQSEWLAEGRKLVPISVMYQEHISQEKIWQSISVPLLINIRCHIMLLSWNLRKVLSLMIRRYCWIQCKHCVQQDSTCLWMTSVRDIHL